VIRWHNRVVGFACIRVTDRYQPFRLSPDPRDPAMDGCFDAAVAASGEGDNRDCQRLRRRITSPIRQQWQGQRRVCVAAGSQMDESVSD
jgi:hypothetical protein